MADIIIGGTIHSSATGNVAARANEILDSDKGKKQSVINQEVDEALNDIQERTDDLEEAVGTGGSVDTRIANAVNTEKTRAEAKETQLMEIYQALDQSALVVLGENDELPNPGVAKTIYRKFGGSSYTDYMYDSSDLTTPIPLATYDNALDDKPTKDSPNLVKSGGVEKYLPVFNLVGNNNTVVKSSFYDVKVGHTYRIWIKNPNISMEGVTYSSSAYPRLGIEAFDDNKETRLGNYLVYIGCDVTALDDYYDFEIPEGGTFIRITIRAMRDAVLTAIVEDITSLCPKQTINGMYIDKDHLVNLSSGQYSYRKDTNWDCAWIAISPNITKIEVNGLGYNPTRHYFKSAIINNENILDVNTTGIVPKGTVYCLVHVNKTDHPGGFEGAEFIKVSAVEDYIMPVKNLLDKSRFVTGKYYGTAGVTEDAKGIVSHNLYLRDGETYTISNCVINGYSSYGITIATFIDDGTEEGERLGGYKVPAIVDREVSATSYLRWRGHATFTYRKGEEDFIRITIQGNVGLDINMANSVMLEVGSEITSYAPYNAVKTYNFAPADYGVIKYKVSDLEKEVAELELNKKKLNILAIGNSNSQDSLSYVPFLLKNIAPEVELNIGILMLSSSSFAHHIENFDNALIEGAPHTAYQKNSVTMYEDGKSYVYHSFEKDDTAWHTTGSESSGENLISIQDGLGKISWDIILFNATAYSGDVQSMFIRIVNYLTYPAKIGIINPAISIAKGNGRFYTGEGDETHGRPYSEGHIGDTDNTTLYGRWYLQLNGAREVMEQTVCDVVFPVNAAVCNALTIENTKKLGDLAVHRNNRNYIDDEDHSKGCFGYLRAPDGVHLQEGLPCQIAAYAVIYKLFEVLGMSYRSVIGDTTICDSSWIEDKAIPGKHPSEDSGPSYENKNYTSVDVHQYATTGWSNDDDENQSKVKMAQMCAVMANKNPYSITDMNNICNPVSPTE